jgi:hypothetical protein
LTSGRVSTLFVYDYLRGFFLFSFAEIVSFITEKSTIKALEQILDEDLITIIEDYKYFDRELIGSITEILDVIKKNSKKLKLKSKDKDLITEFINVVYDMPNVPDCGYSLIISTSEEGCYHSNQYWSVVIAEYKFEVDKMNSMYDKEVGSDSFTVYSYIQYPGKYPVVEGYFSNWQYELLEVLSGNYIGNISVSITKGNEYL